LLNRVIAAFIGGNQILLHRFMSRSNRSIDHEILKSLPRASKFLIAVSGGVDSVVLFNVCVRMQKILKGHFEIAHVDHGVRKDSAKDASFVKRIGDRVDIPVHTLRAKPPKSMKGLEAWGRETRYSFFETIRSERRLDFILTAHNANDAAETLLMRLVSNRDVSWIASMDTKRNLIRPLLRIPRAEIEAYAEKQGIEWREDSTNSDQHFLRNRVRHTLLPVLARHFDPRIVESLSERGRALQLVDEAVDKAVEKPLLKIRVHKLGTKEWLSAVVKAFKTLSPGGSSRLAEQLLLPVLGFKLGMKKSLDVVSFLSGKELGIQLPSGLTLRRSKGGVEVKDNGKMLPKEHTRRKKAK